MASTTACNIKAWMAQRGITNARVARSAAVSRVMVSYVINGKRTSTPVLKTIACLCRVSLADLLAGPENTTKHYKEAA